MSDKENHEEVEEIATLLPAGLPVDDETALSRWKEEIARLRGEYLPLTIDGVDDKGGYVIVHEARMRVKSIRIEIEKRRKDAKAGLLEAGRKIDAAAKEITSELKPIEDHLQEQEKRIDDEKREAKRAQAEERKRRLDERCEKLREVECFLQPSLVDSMSDRDFEATLTRYREALEQRKAKEREQEELRRKAEEIAASERDRREEERRESERRAEEERKRLEAERDEYEKRFAEEKARIEAERSQERAELQRLRKQVSDQAETSTKSVTEVSGEIVNAAAHGSTIDEAVEALEEGIQEQPRKPVSAGQSVDGVYPGGVGPREARPRLVQFAEYVAELPIWPDVPHREKIRNVLEQAADVIRSFDESAK